MTTKLGFAVVYTVREGVPPDVCARSIKEVCASVCRPLPIAYTDIRAHTIVLDDLLEEFAEVAAKARGSNPQDELYSIKHRYGLDGAVAAAPEQEIMKVRDLVEILCGPQKGCIGEVVGLQTGMVFVHYAGGEFCFKPEEVRLVVR